MQTRNCYGLDAAAFLYISSGQTREGRRLLVPVGLAPISVGAHGVEIRALRASFACKAGLAVAAEIGDDPAAEGPAGAHRDGNRFCITARGAQRQRACSGLCGGHAAVVASDHPGRGAEGLAILGGIEPGWLARFGIRYVGDRTRHIGGEVLSGRLVRLIR